MPLQRYDLNDEDARNQMLIFTVSIKLVPSGLDNRNVWVVGNGVTDGGQGCAPSPPGRL